MTNRYTAIREEAYAANMQLPALGLVLFTFGNASAADRSQGVFAIKPSGVPYEKLSPDNMVIVDFDGKTVEGDMRPSSDTLTHAELYKEWTVIGGIAHTHSTYATAWAQSLRDIPVYGTTHADYSTMVIPCAAPMGDEMIRGNYEKETGRQIISCLQMRGIDPAELQMILVGSHAPFTWGGNAAAAVHNSAVLEYLAKTALLTESIRPGAEPLKEALLKKHFERKHGPGRYYGQDK